MCCNCAINKCSGLQNFPVLRNDPSILRQISRDAAKKRHNLNLVSYHDERFQDDDEMAFVDYVFLPHFPVHGDVNDGDFDVSVFVILCS